MKVLVGLDGTLQSKDALKYGLEKIRKDGGELFAIQVFDSGLFVDYDASPAAEEMARAESQRYVEDAKQIIRESGKGIRATLMAGDGNPSEEIIEFAHSRNIDLLLCTPRLKSVIGSFGRTAQEKTAITAAEETQFEMVSIK